MTIKKTVIYFTAVFSFLFILSACDSTSNDISKNVPNNDALLVSVTGQEGRECLREDDIRGFGIIEEDIISVDSRKPDEYFLITTLYNCPSLEFTMRLGFSAPFNELCGGARDKVVTPDTICPIRSVFKFDNRKQAFAAIDKIDALRKKHQDAAKPQTEKDAD